MLTYNNQDEERLLANSPKHPDSEKWTTAPIGESEAPWVRRLRAAWPWLGHVILLSISTTLFASAFCARQSSTKAPQCPDKPAWSPAQEAVSYETMHFDLPMIPTGPYVGKGPEVDAAWDEITNLPDIMISAEEMAKINMPTENALFITDPETGKQGYRVALEVFHQLHCLNLLRQNRFYGHYSEEDGDVAAPKEDLVGHLDHCIDALRQLIMCTSDVGVFPFYYETPTDAWPDYSTPHTCRNYERVRQWALDHAVRKGPDEPEH